MLGIVGHGTLGKAVAGIARAFGMRVEIANRPGGTRAAGRRDLDDLLPELDVLSLHCPLNEATRGLVSRERLARMKPDAVLINTARGALVDIDCARRRTEGRHARRRRDRRARARAATPGHPLIDPIDPEPHRHAARRLGRARGPAALPRRARAERSLVPLRRPSQPRRLILSRDFQVPAPSNRRTRTFAMTEGSQLRMFTPTRLAASGDSVPSAARSRNACSGTFGSSGRPRRRPRRRACGSGSAPNPRCSTPTGRRYAGRWSSCRTRSLRGARGSSSRTAPQWQDASIIERDPRPAS